MKKISGIVSIILILTMLSACGSKEVNKPAASEAPTKESKSKVTTAQQLAEKFKQEGLEVGEIRKMEAQDYGIIPKTAKEGIRVFTPSLGEDAGGRVMLFDKEDELSKVKEAYDNMGKQSAMLFSHTYAKGNFLLQMAGEMKEDQFKKYQDVMDKVID